MKTAVLNLVLVLALVLPGLPVGDDLTATAGVKRRNGVGRWPYWIEPETGSGRADWAGVAGFVARDLSFEVVDEPAGFGERD